MLFISLPMAKPGIVEQEHFDALGIAPHFTIDAEKITAMKPRSYGCEIQVGDWLYGTTFTEREVIQRIAEYSIAVWIDVDGHAFPSRPVAMK